MPSQPQNKKYLCAIGNSVAGSQVSSTPSARTTSARGSRSIVGWSLAVQHGVGRIRRAAALQGHERLADALRSARIQPGVQPRRAASMTENAR